MNRENTINILKANPEFLWDILIIGGGATGLGTALDGALRGFKTLLLEQSDFTKGTSSRSTKLVHGGVRYLAQGDIGLVLEALRERGLLLKNAPHVTSNQTFIVPAFSNWKTFFYGAGLKLYDILSGRLSLGKSQIISKYKTQNSLPNLKSEKLKNGILYHDGQFDDARLGISIAQTSSENGAFLANYMQVTDLKKSDQHWDVTARDLETNGLYTLKSKVVINSTGVFVDEITGMENKNTEAMVRPSQGTHIVIDSKFLPGNHALMIPETSDGRVLFMIPWHGKVLVGTTDTLVEKAELEPVPLEKEVDFILENLKSYLKIIPEKKDILSVFTGLRPLAKPAKSDKSTKEISRRHKLIVSERGLITITGGKWTTYRQMAEETIDLAIKTGQLKHKVCLTRKFKIHGYSEPVPEYGWLNIYGSDAQKILELIKFNSNLSEKLHRQYPHCKAEVIWFIRNEMARTVEDVLARRIRILFLDAKAAVEMAPVVSRIIASELNKEENWVQNQINEFTKLAKRYLPEGQL